MHCRVSKLYICDQSNWPTLTKGIYKRYEPANVLCFDEKDFVWVCIESCWRLIEFKAQKIVYLEAQNRTIALSLLPWVLDSGSGIFTSPLCGFQILELAAFLILAWLWIPRGGFLTQSPRFGILQPDIF